LLLIAAPLRAAHTVALGWTASTDAGVAYNVYRAPGTIGTGNLVACPVKSTPVVTPWVQIASGLTGLMYTDSTVSVGNAYCYYATATLGSLESNPSNTSSAAILPRGPSALVATAH
jgi:hypothetical protein